MIALDNVSYIDVPAPNQYLTFFRLIEDSIDITDTVIIKHKFNPRRVIVESAIPINGFIEIM